MNDKSKAYHRIACRYADAAEAGHLAALQESSGFSSYHAVESLGGALCSSVGADYDKLDHTAKLNQFVAVANRGGLSRKVGYQVATVVSIVASVRNQFLYPYPRPDGSYQLPEEVIDLVDAKNAFKRVRGLIRKVERVI